MEIKTFASGSTGNLHLVKIDGVRILLECGLSIAKINKHLDFKLPDACLLSHSHGDHSKSAKKIMENGVDLYCRKETADSLELSGHRLKVIQSRFQVEGVDVFAFRTDHDTPGSVAYLLTGANDRVLFATDTGSFPYEIPGMTCIMIEANYSPESITEENDFVLKRTLKTHLSIDKTIDFLKRNDLSKVREIHLIHLSDKNSDPKMFKRRVQAATGKVVIVS